MAACPHCGEANPANARFCNSCGKPLSAGPDAPREMRKTVTIVFCDVIDSTPLGGKLEAETYRRVISRYFIEASRVLEHYGGTIEKFVGDAVMAVFGIPTVHEDDALRAVRAATDLREALAQLNAQLQDELGIELGVRIGVNTGEVVAGDPAEGQAFATGEAVVVAQRLETAAGGGEILIGESTHRLVRDAVLVEPMEPLELKGVGAKAAWRLLGVVAGATGIARRLDSPLVGRERELSILEQAFRRAADERACHLFTVFGVAGVGKSRLVNELIEMLSGEARILVGRCVPYGEGMTFWPLREMVRQAASISAKVQPDEAKAKLAQLLEGDPEAETVASRLAAATGLAEGKSTNEETFWAVRKLVERHAAEQPLVLVFDDVQWAEPAFLDLADHLADWTRNAPVLILCMARPELLDERPGWGGGKVNAGAIQLQPLRGDDVERMVENFLAGNPAPPELTRSMREAGEGNPLFVEEMLGMLVDQGRLNRESGVWSVEALQRVDTPPTLQALIAARLDRLAGPARDAIGRASVIGKVFSVEALAALGDDQEGLDACLDELDRRDLIRPDPTSMPGDETYRFRHILIRDGAYQGLPKEQRADLHERLADWLQASRPELEYEEVLAFHLEQAYRYRHELWETDDRTLAVAQRAATYLAAAGRRAMDRGDMAAAAGLLTRATLLLRDDDCARVELAPDLGLALSETGELERADAGLARAIETAEELGDKPLMLRAALERAMVGARIDPSWKVEEVRRVAEESIQVFEETDDDQGLTRAWFVLGFVYWLEAHWAERSAALEQVLVFARRSGDRRQEAQALGALALSLTWGATPVLEGIARCEQMLAEVEGQMHLKSRVLVALAELRAQLGEFDEGRRLYAESKTLAEEYGLHLVAGLQSLSSGGIELLAGQPAAAVRELRWGYEILRRMGEKISLSTNAALLAEALYRLGDLPEAERFTQISEENAPAEDVASQALYRGTRAKILARRGETEFAERLAREAVDVANRADAINLQGDSLVSLAGVLWEIGKFDESRETVKSAIELYERKGNVVSAAQALAALEASR